MKITPFKLERYFAQYEFAVKYLLSSSDCDGFAMKNILELATPDELSLWSSLELGYTESQGLPILRREICKLYTSITPEDLIVMAPEEGIFIAMNSILDKGDHVICVAPCYQSLHEVVRSIGCKISFWYPHEEKGWYFDPEDLKEMVQANTKLIIINFPHNPTGYLPKKDDYLSIVDIARQTNCFLFSDEMYRCLEHDALLRLPSASDLYEKAISLSGLSKTFGLAGLRLGWLCIKSSKLIQDFIALKDYTTICNSAPTEILGFISLRHKEALIDINLKKIRYNIELLDRFISNHNNLFSWTKPKAGTIGFARLSIEQSTLDFCENMVQKAGIMAVPSEMFAYGDKHIRIGFGRRNLSEVLDVLDNYLKT